MHGHASLAPRTAHPPAPSQMHPGPPSRVLPRAHTFLLYSCHPALTNAPRPSPMPPGPLMWPRILSHAGCMDDAPPCSSSVPELRPHVCCITPGLRSLRSCAPCCSCWSSTMRQVGPPAAAAAATAGRGLGDACTCARGGGHWRWIRGSLDQGVTGSGSVMHWLDLGGSGSGFGVHMRSGGHWIWIWREC